MVSPSTPLGRTREDEAISNTTIRFRDQLGKPHSWRRSKI
jgi:hypothetical protein